MLVVILCVGCGGGAKQVVKKPVKKKPVFDKPLPVYVTAGDAYNRKPAPSRALLYHIKWTEAQLQASDEGIFAGTMEGVTGEIYDKDGKGKVASTFKGDHAEAAKATLLLTVTNHIQIESLDRKAMLTCDRVEWQGNEKMYKAFGNVVVRGTFGELTGLNEVWATDDLAFISTPDAFKRPPKAIKRP